MERVLAMSMSNYLTFCLRFVESCDVLSSFCVLRGY